MLIICHFSNYTQRFSSAEGGGKETLSFRLRTKLKLIARPYRTVNCMTLSFRQAFGRVQFYFIVQGKIHKIKRFQKYTQPFRLSPKPVLFIGCVRRCFLLLFLFGLYFQDFCHNPPMLFSIWDYLKLYIQSYFLDFRIIFISSPQDCKVIPVFSKIPFSISVIFIFPIIGSPLIFSINSLLL